MEADVPCAIHPALSPGAPPHRASRAAPRSDRGAATVLMLATVAAILVAVLTAMVPVAADLIARQRANSAADAAALAGVNGGYAASRSLAEVNGATLVSWSSDGDVVTVTVRFGSFTAQARATDAP